MENSRLFWGFGCVIFRNGEESRWSLGDWFRGVCGYRFVGKEGFGLGFWRGNVVV